MNELILQVRQNPGNIQLNFDELERQLDDKLSEYKGAVFTEESKGMAKAEVASLRKLKKEIDDTRKAVKKEWMKPYDEFETRMKRLTSKVDEPIQLIDKQVKEFDQKRKEEKRASIRALYEETRAEYEEYADYISLEKLYDPRWENTSVSTKTIKKSLREQMESIKTAIMSIRAMRSDKEADALKLYKNTLDLNKAVQLITTYEQNKAEALKREEQHRQQEEEQRRLTEIEQIRTMEREAITREEQIRRETREQTIQEAKETVDRTVEIPEIPDDELPFEQPKTITAFYRVVATKEELEAVEMAFNSIGIYFERRDS